MKLLSFAIPCYNSEAYMEKCIDSILPGGEDIEILIIDDGSKDRTAEIADANLCKGKEVLLYGKMQSGSYMNKDGKKVYTLQMRVDEIEFCGKKSESRMSYEDDFMNMSNCPDEEMPFR